METGCSTTTERPSFPRLNYPGFQRSLQSAHAHAYQVICLTRHIPAVPSQKFPLPAAKARHPHLPNVRTATRGRGTDFQEWAISTDGCTRLVGGETLDGWCAIARSPHGRIDIMFGPVITTDAHLAFTGASVHSNNTAEMSAMIVALSFLWPHGLVAREAHACCLSNCKHAAGVCLGTTQARTHAQLALSCQQLLLKVQYTLRFTSQHVYGQAENFGNECADHAAALGAFGLVSNHNFSTRWKHHSFDSASYFATFYNLGDVLEKLRDLRTEHVSASRQQTRS